MSRVTLTFDNGPTPSTTPAVLEQLALRGLNAYFCVIGRQLQRSEASVDIARHTLECGHTLVNHSMTHGTALGDDTSHAHAAREILDADQLLAESLGDWGERWFRPFGRGGAIGPHLLSRASVDALVQCQYSVMLWNAIPRDWEDAEGWVATALRQINAQSHAVLVLHDIDSGAMRQLGAFLDTLLDQGHEITQALPDQCVPMLPGRLNWSEQAFAGILSG